MSAARLTADASHAIERALAGLELYDLRVDINGCVHLRGLAGTPEARRLAGVRAHAALPDAFICNDLRVAEFRRVRRCR